MAYSFLISIFIYVKMYLYSILIRMNIIIYITP